MRESEGESKGEGSCECDGYRARIGQGFERVYGFTKALVQGRSRSNVGCACVSAKGKGKRLTLGLALVRLGLR